MAPRSAVDDQQAEQRAADDPWKQTAAGTHREPVQRLFFTKAQYDTAAPGSIGRLVRAALA
jgi:hypothetical protein